MWVSQPNTQTSGNEEKASIMFDFAGNIIVSSMFSLNFSLPRLPKPLKPRPRPSLQPRPSRPSRRRQSRRNHRRRLEREKRRERRRGEAASEEDAKNHTSESKSLISVFQNITSRLMVNIGENAQVCFVCVIWIVCEKNQAVRTKSFIFFSLSIFLLHYYTRIRAHWLSLLDTQAKFMHRSDTHVCHSL